jgi:Zn-finger nucleic acid-binding protein
VADVPRSVRLPAWLEVAKPRLIPLLLATTVGGMALSAAWPLDPQRLLATLVGGAMASAAAGVLNCLWEQELDGRMQRTSRRALPSGRLAQRQAFLLAIALTTGSVLLLVTAVFALIYKAMEPDPGHRFQTASAMRAALVDYLERSLARMPLEQVRRLLRAGEVTADADGPVAATTQSREGPAATEDPPTLAKRCGKCGGSFDAVYVDGMIIDRCRSCRGLWFDHAEIQRVMGPSGPKLNLTDDEAPSPSTPSRAPLDPLMGSCPSCKVGLRPFGVPGTTSALEVCPRCLGVWFDRDEVDLMTRPDVVSWFRSVIDGMRFSADR